jgi:hypothetical protein
MAEKPGKVEREAIRFEFVRFGICVDLATARSGNSLYLDVGNALGPGVIDHHHLAAFSGSTARLVRSQPELVLESVQPGRDPSVPFSIVLHVDPDLDGLISAYLAIALLTTGACPPGTDALVHYADWVDSGRPGISQDHPYSLYAAYTTLSSRLSLRTWENEEDRYEECVREGLEVVAYVARKVAEGGKSLLEIDAFQTPGLFGPQDRAEVRRDLDRYETKLRDPATQARCLRLRLPGVLGGSSEVDTLLVRDVQNPDDTDRVLFFKDWARSDRQRASERGGFVATSVFMSRSYQGVRRCILSVRPDAGVSLRGLGALLDAAESARRRELGDDAHREPDPSTGEHEPPRPGYATADPWYDGRAHGDTIVDSPRSGTVLSAEEIERIFLQFGGRTEDEIPPVSLPDDKPTDERAAISVAHRLSSLTDAYRTRNLPALDAEPPQLFVSYPHSRIDWVEQHLFHPLRAWRSDLRIFLDRHTLAGGVPWLARLAEGIDRCRVFLPVYCHDYFQSEYCQWELQLGLVRDPVGRKGIVVPILIEPVILPSYCALIHAEDARRPDFLDRLERILGEVLPGPA